MAELAIRESALHGLALTSRPGTFGLTPSTFCARYVYRGAAQTLRRTLDLSDVLPICRATTTDDFGVLRLGPDEWLILCRSTKPEAAIKRSLGRDGCFVDVTRRNFGLELSGPRSADVLATGCPLDFHSNVFDVNTCCRTILGKAEVVIWKSDESTFYLEGGRSFAAYVVTYIELAVRGLPTRSA